MLAGMFVSTSGSQTMLLQPGVTFDCLFHPIHLCVSLGITTSQITKLPVL
jgi:hypothetical protein